jgi:transcriptional regulator with XRE-family HTH domain
MKIREVFARNLRRRRHARGLSQEALAHEADMDRTYISALERGLYSASIDTVAKPAEVLDIDSVCQSLREANPPMLPTVRDFALRIAKFQNQILLICNACCAGA